MPGEPPGEPCGDDPVARAILELLETVPPGRSISPVAAARAFAILRKGKPVDPHALFKGVVRLGRVESR